MADLESLPRPLGWLSVAFLFLLDHIISVSLPCPHACSHPVPPSEPRPWDFFFLLGGSSLSLSGSQLKGPSICQSCACWNGPRVWQEGPRWLRSKNQDTNVVFAGVEMGPGRDTLSIQGGVISCWSGEGSVPERVPCGDQNKFPNISNFRLCFGESEEGCQGPWTLEKQ